MINDIITAIVWLGTLAALASVGVYMRGMEWRTNPIGWLMNTKDVIIAVILGYVAIRRTLNPPAPPPDHIGLISLVIYSSVMLVEIATAIVVAYVIRKGR